MDEGYQHNKLNKNGVEKHLRRRSRNSLSGFSNLNSKRDWGSAKDYVESMWLMLKAKKPSDYVIATGKSYTVKNFVEEAFKYIGRKI